jgi:hypothetical protein
MEIEPLHATGRHIKYQMLFTAEIDQAKVRAIMIKIVLGEELPPVVAAIYGDTAMPLDGHHRMFAHGMLDREVDAYTVDGEAFDELDAQAQDEGLGKRAEDYILCDGVPAKAVAANWMKEHAR